MHGPGCPVCVTSLEMIDRAHAIAVAARRDLLLVRRHAPRARARAATCLQLKSQGSDVRIVYSPLDAVNLAAANPDRQVVFFAIGFETTAPANAMAVWLARKRGLDELQRAGVARAGAAGDDGAARVRPTTACRASSGPATSARSWATSEYEPIAARYRVPIVITGFEPLDLLEGILRTVRQLEAGRAEVENPYARAVRPEGNPAVAAADRRRLRGLRPQVARRRPDPAERLSGCATSIATTTPSGVFEVDDIETQESSVCISGQILRAEEAARLPGVRPRMHAADAAGRDDGLVRRGVRRLLRLRPPSRAAGDRQPVA